jgi:hypothetical protein
MFFIVSHISSAIDTNALEEKRKRKKEKEKTVVYREK